ncbi:DUF58 domain-containing protein [Nitrincola tapanii]|nr:DUF58 domain-containing protein [Nitrincola tapanii]
MSGSAWQMRWRRWSRQPDKVYILPTRPGWGFMLLLCLLLLLAINFENNLAYALTFLLTGVMLVAMLHTWANLNYLRVRPEGAQHCFAGEAAVLRIRVEMPGRQAAEQLEWWVQDTSPWICDIPAGSLRPVDLSLPTQARGWCWPPAIKLQSRWPLGLFRAWRWLPPIAPFLVYPKPLKPRFLPAQALTDGQGPPLAVVQGSDDFDGLRPFQPGMSPQHIAWKAYARGQGLHARRYSAQEDEQHWLDWSTWPSAGVEQRLSEMCYQALRWQAQQEPFGLRFPDQEISPALGEAHLQRVLLALALFGQEASVPPSGGPHV